MCRIVVFLEHPVWTYVRTYVRTYFPTPVGTSDLKDWNWRQQAPAIFEFLQEFEITSLYSLHMEVFYWWISTSSLPLLTSCSRHMCDAEPDHVNPEVRRWKEDRVYLQYTVVAYIYPVYCSTVLYILYCTGTYSMKWPSSVPEWNWN
jgi:hypothetical protein